MQSENHIPNGAVRHVRGKSLTDDGQDPNDHAHHTRRQSHGHTNQVPNDAVRHERYHSHGDGVANGPLRQEKGYSHGDTNYVPNDQVRHERGHSHGNANHVPNDQVRHERGHSHGNTNHVPNDQIRHERGHSHGNTNHVPKDQVRQERGHSHGNTNHVPNDQVRHERGHSHGNTNHVPNDQVRHERGHSHGNTNMNEPFHHHRLSQDVPNDPVSHERRQSSSVDINQNDHLMVKEIFQYFKHESSHLTYMLKECREQFEALEMNKQAIEKEITCVREEINKHLDNIESRLRSQLDEIHKEATKLCQNRILDLERRQCSLFEYQRRLEHVCRFWSQRRDSDVADIQTFYSNIVHANEDKIRSFEYDFRINDRIDTLKEKVRYLGEVKLLTYVSPFNDSGLPDPEVSGYHVDLRDCVASVSKGFAISEDQSSAVGGCVCLHNGLIMIGNRLTNSLQKVNV